MVRGKMRESRRESGEVQGASGVGQVRGRADRADTQAGGRADQTRQRRDEPGLKEKPGGGRRCDFCCNPPPAANSKCNGGQMNGARVPGSQTGTREPLLMLAGCSCRTRFEIGLL